MTASGGVAVLAATMLAAGTTAEAASPAISVADAYTVSTMPNENRGDSTKIAVGLDAEDRKTGFIRFDRQTGDSDSGLHLELSVTGGNAGNLEVHQVGSDWTEQGVTATNEPSLDSLVGNFAVAGGAQTIRIPLVGLQSGEDGTVSLALTRAGNGVSRIASREGGAELAPKFTSDVETGSPAPTPAPSPVPTPTPVPAPVPDPAAPECSVSAILVPSCGSWFGATANPLSGESWDTALANFEETAGRTMDIAHYYKRGQSALFPNEVELNRQDEAGKNRILFYNWKPTGLTWRQVAEGAADGYLQDLAAHMNRHADKPFYLSLNAEMEDEVDLAPGSGQTPADFRNFFRHVVEELRGNGVDNAVTVMNYTGIEKWGEMPWFNDLYPGNDVVDWIAQDPYAFGKPPVWLTDFAGMVNRTDGGWPGFYNWAAINYPDKPQMLAEWGVDEDPAYPTYKRDYFNTAADQLAQHPKIKAVVYWDSTGIDTSGNPLIVGDTRVDSTPSSLNAFRSFVDSDILTAPRKSYLDR
ncbi:DNRLRE domain-containing protein [Arthrobacter sp. H20]|uniref:CBM96 family carbohydrate-binding protein n=1 Tax=Arthrobacter sp. H20 TaxID=1267981 RepID=UPI0004B2E6B1|nr:DNRLRE domain-containing protein [Arthrobacter sp. H20]